MIGLIKNLLKVLTPQQRKEYIFLQVFVVFTAVAEVVSVAAMGPFMALVGNVELINSHPVVNSIFLKTGLSNPMDFLFVVGIVVLSLLFLSASVSVFTIWKLSFFAARTGAEIGDTLYEYYLNKDFLYHTRTTSAQLTKQIATEVSRITDHVLQPLVQINARIVAAIFISIVIFLYNPIISLVGLCLFFTCYYVLFIVVRGRLARNGEAITRVSKQRFTLMNEGFGAIKDVQLLGRQESFTTEFKESGKVFAEAYGSSNGLYNMPRYLMEFVIYSGMITLVLLLLRLSGGDLSEVLPVLAVFGIAAFKLLPSFQQIYTSAAQIKSNLSAFDAIKEDILSARSANTVGVSPASNLTGLGGDIELSDISFSYPGKDSSALNGANLKISAKHVVGIVGPSGSGKSTLLDVMLGLIWPKEGTLSIGGEMIAPDNLREWQQSIGYVPQAIFLKEGSLVENIAFGLSPTQVDMDKVANAVKLAQLDEWISALPDGLMTCVGERGVQLSGGQRQRIGIARALYNNAEYLFFDEATSALDGITENLIMEAIENISGDKTIVMIAHRLNTVKSCDLIYMVESGRIVDQGSYEYLLTNNAHFKKMVNSK
jgi:ABC-type multidrug transport system fused ATPase/permease subunit